MAVERFEVVVAGEHFCSATITVRPANGPGTRVPSIGNPAGKPDENVMSPIGCPRHCGVVSGHPAKQWQAYLRKLMVGVGTRIVDPIATRSNPACYFYPAGKFNVLLGYLAVPHIHCQARTG